MLEFRFADIGEGINEGVILKWLVEVGQEVKEGDSLFLVETDKVNAEIPSPADGRIAALLANEGDLITVGQVVVHIDTGDGDVAPTVQPSEQIDSVKEGDDDDAGAVVGALVSSSAVLPSSVERAEEGEEIHAGRRKVLATPVARKLARDLGVDITTIEGTGPGGRVMKEDIRRAAAQPHEAPAQVQPAAVSPAPLPEGPNEERIPLRALDKAIARNMAQSKREIPHAYVMKDVDVTELVAFRAEAKILAEERGLKLTYLPFIVKAVTLALQEYPRMNGSFDEAGQVIVMKKDFNIGIAVDTPDGLLVPVLKHADRLGIFAIAERMNELIEAARSRTVSLDDLQQGTFTITNYGAVGADSGIPVIRPPEAGILGVGSISKRPVVGEDDEIVIRQILPLTASFDHRFVDGATAGRFLTKVAEYLQNPKLLMLS